MSNWISKKQAIKDAQVTPFDAKRYLDSFCKFVPPGNILQGNLVDPIVPFVLSNFKTMENAGLTMAQIEQSLSKNMIKNETINKITTNNIVCEKNEQSKLLLRITKIVQEQSQVQKELIKLIKLFNTELSILQQRVIQLEKETLRTE